MPLHHLTFRGQSYVVYQPDGDECLCDSRRHAALFTFEDESDVRERWWCPQPEEVVMDVGACFGSYSITACCMGAMVYAYEPDAESASLLDRNLQLNGFQHSCKIRRVALWHEMGWVREPQYALHSSRHDEPFVAVTLDSEVDGLRLSRLDWVKIDVEGAELHVLEGGKESIQRFKPNMLVECHQFISADMTTRVRDMLLSMVPGYRIDVVERHPVAHLFGQYEEA